MTNSARTAPARAGKRERLVSSASELLHRQGVHPTTLAEIAAAADVPLGNVYYYFKTKDELLRAVIDAEAAEIRARLATFDARRTPNVRLKAFVRWWLEIREQVAQFGCPLGSLASELDKRSDGLEREVAVLFGIVADWAESQFREIGGRDARGRAITLLAGIQGASLLANTFKDPEILAAEVHRLERWIDNGA